MPRTPRSALLPLVGLAAASLALAAFWLARSPSDARVARESAAPGGSSGRAGAGPADDRGPTPGPLAPGEAAPSARDGERRVASPSSEQDAAPAPGLALTGRVEDGRGAVAGATLRLFAEPLRPAAGASPAAEASSDEQGGFRFADLAPGARWTLHVQAEDHLPNAQTTFTGVEALVRLEAAASVTGHVVRARTREPVPDAEVSLDRGAFTPAGWVTRVSTRTDAEGAFRLALAAPGIERLTVARPGTWPETFEVQVPETGGEGYELRVSEPVARVALIDLASGAPLVDTPIECNRGTARTDEAGVLAIPGGAFPDDERVELRLRRPGEVWTRSRLALEGRASRPASVLPVARGARVRGRVVDAGDRPVAQASVRRVGGGRALEVVGLPEGVWFEEEGATATTDDEGRFELRGLLPRSLPVRARAQHPAQADGYSEPFVLETLATEVETVVRLERGATITGRVLVDGAPASLRVGWSGERGRGWTRSDESGAYRLAGVPPGRIVLGARLEVEERDSPCDEDVVLVVEDGATIEQDLSRSPRTARLAGRVLDELGRPLSAVLVMADARLPDAPRPRESALSDDAGRFEIEVPHLEAAGDSGETRWRLRARDGASETVREGVAPGSLDVVLVLPARARLAVAVLSARGREPLPGFRLYWRLHDPPEDLEDDIAGLRWERVSIGGRSPAPGPDGRFVVELPAARLDLVAAAPPRYALADVETVELAPDGSGTVRFLLEEDVPLVVEVSATDENPAQRARTQRALMKQGVTVVPEALWADRRRGGDLLVDARRTGLCDGAGRTEVRGLAPGPVRVDGPRGVTMVPQRFALAAVDRHEVRLEAHTGPGGEKPRGERR